MNQNYGMQLIVDGYGANPHTLASIDTIYRFLDGLPAKIGMEKIGPPQLANFDDPEIAGITGVIQIITSHISIHTYAKKGCLFLDVFSCKPFDAPLVIAHATDIFNITRIETTIVERGKHFPTKNLHP